MLGMCPGQESSEEILSGGRVSLPGIIAITVPTGKNGGTIRKKDRLLAKKSSAHQVTFFETIPDILHTSAVGFTDSALSA